VARLTALTAAIAASLLAVSGAGGASAQTPKRGGTLVYRLLSPEPPCLNILSDSCVGPAALWGIADAVLEKPLEQLPNFTYRPQLATATFTKRRPFTLTYRINPGARWSDGKPITSRDFVFTLHAIRRYGYQALRDPHAVVRSIHTVDAKRFKVVLKPRSSVWRDLFGNILPEHALRGTDLSKVWTTSIDNPKTGAPIGSGPFLVERWDRGRQLVLRRNPRYWGSHTSYVDRIIVLFASFADPDPPEALRNGVDIAWGVPYDFVPGLRRERGIRVTAVSSPVIEHLDFQQGPEGHPALRSKLVRRALAYGIDREQIVRRLYGAVDPSQHALDSLVLVTQSPAYAATWRSYRYRPARARQLLDQAGCRRGSDQIYTCAGKRLSLRFVTTSGPREQVLSLVQAQLREVGVEVVPAFAAGRTLFDQILPGGTFDAALYSWEFTPGSSWSEVYGCGGPANFTGYCQRLVTADLNQAGRILDARQQARVLNRADARMSNDVPSLPLHQRVGTAALHTEVRNYVLHPSGLSPFWNAENWWLDR
jgi:peptide/nickel transport system substrate-binding protein